MKPRHSVLGAAIIALAACAQSPPPAAETAAPPTAPVFESADSAVAIEAPAGQYKLDPTHSSLSFSVNHMGLSNYVARFTRYDASLELDPENLSASSLVATIDPASVTTDHSGDYRATHPGSKFATWDEDLAKSDKFFHAEQHPSIEFRSTSVEETGPGTFRVVGKLTFLGQTQPLTLDTKLVGSTAKHPMMGIGAIGFSATGTFKRSAFGMNHLLQQALVGDDVSLAFEGEFAQAVAAEQPAG